MGQQARTTVALAGLALVGVVLAGKPALPHRARAAPQPHPIVSQDEAADDRHISVREWNERSSASVDGTVTIIRNLSWLDLTLPRSGLHRTPTRPTLCTNPPPGGVWQVAAIENARRRKCTEALDAWREGMKVSEDHCSLARMIWLCYNEVDENALKDHWFMNFDALVPLLVHLEGTPSARAAYAQDIAAIGAPIWSWPAPTGLEYRLDAFLWDKPFQESVLDLLNPPTIADNLATDLLLESKIMTALARLPAAERTPMGEEVLARRVYVVGEALYGLPGELLQKFRPETYEELHTALEEAMIDAPEQVRTAYAVAKRKVILELR